MLVVKKIGILAGTFDPVHQGHVAFALAAIEVSELDKVIFLPEARPRGKTKVSPLKHRLKMLTLATKPYKQLAVLDLKEPQFTIAGTLPQLQKLYAGSQLYLLIGSDVQKAITTWPHAQKLLDEVDLIVGQRSAKPKANKSVDATIYTNYAGLSSSALKKQLQKGQLPHGLDPAVAKYIAKNKLYKT